MDLSQFDTVKSSDAGAEVQLRHPGTDELIDVWITVLGPDSDVFAEARRDVMRQRRLSLAAEKRSDITAADVARDDSEILSRVTIAWRSSKQGILVIDGEDVAFSTQAALQFYLRFPRFRSQVDGFILNVANFMQPSASDS